MTHSTLGKTLQVEGTLSGQGSVTVLGELQGTIGVDGDVHLPQGARVKADVTADNIEVGGEVEGNLRARDRVEVFSHGQVVGDIQAPKILIANGARFRGNVAF